MMSEQDSTTARRRGRLRQVHYDAAWEISHLFRNTDHPGNGSRQTVRLRLKKLLAEAGVERGEMDERRAYLAAIWQLKDTKGRDDSSHAEAIRKAVAVWQQQEQERRREREQREQPPAKNAERPKRTFEMGKITFLGIEDGDKCETEEVTVDDLKPGDPLLIY